MHRSALATLALVVAAATAAPLHAQDPANVDSAASRAVGRADPARIERATAVRVRRQTQATLQRAESLQRQLDAQARRGVAPTPEQTRSLQSLWRDTDRIAREAGTAPDAQTAYRTARAQAEALMREGDRLARTPEAKRAVDESRNLLLAILRDLSNAFHSDIERRAERSR